MVVARLPPALAALCLASVIAVAFAADVPVGSTVRVTNTQGARLNIREAPSQSAAIVAEVEEGTTLQVIGTEREADGVRWLNVADAGGRKGWASAEFLAVIATPIPPTATPAATATLSPAPPTAAPAATATATPAPSPPEADAPPVPSGDLVIETRVKVPETSDNRQTISVLATRGGAPAAGVQLIAVTQDTDPPLVRDFGATDDEGKSSKSFDIRREKGTVVVVVIAVASDGTKAHAVASYFRR